METILTTPQAFSPGGNYFTLPLKGYVKAGFPLNDEHAHDEGVSLEHFLLSDPQKTYLLRVQNNSLYEEGIRPGDLVILDAKRTPRDNDIVAACIDDEWIVNRFTSVSLKGKNRIGGVVISVIRKFY